MYHSPGYRASSGKIVTRRVGFALDKGVQALFLDELEAIRSISCGGQPWSVDSETDDTAPVDGFDIFPVHNPEKRQVLQRPRAHCSQNTGAPGRRSSR
jgi:hypothetical protein